LQQAQTLQILVSSGIKTLHSVTDQGALAVRRTETAPPPKGTMRAQAAREGLIPLKNWVKGALDQVIEACMGEPAKFAARHPDRALT